MKGSMTSVNHWVRVIQPVVELSLLRAFGRRRVGKRAGGDPVRKGEADALRNKFKRTRVEFEPLNTRCIAGHVNSRR